MRRLLASLGAAILAVGMSGAEARAKQAPVFPTSVSGLAGRWEHAALVEGCPRGCFITNKHGLYVADIVRLTIVDFPSGTLRGTWQEVACAVDRRSYSIDEVGTLSGDGTKVSAYSPISGTGDSRSFTIELTSLAAYFSGGIGRVPFGVTNVVGDEPFLPSPEMFLLSGDTGAYIFYPASYFPALGVCGRG